MRPTNPVTCTACARTATMNMSTREPGRHVIDVCTNVSCCLKGGEKVLALCSFDRDVPAGAKVK